MRVRTIIVSLTALAGLLTPLPAQAAPVVLVAGPLQSPGIFFEEGMHPIFDGCWFATLDSPTATTVVTFIIRKSTHDAYFQITNSCGTYDEVFDFTECVRGPTYWSCEHTRPDGFYASVEWALVNGNWIIDATEHNEDMSRIWFVNGRAPIVGVE